MSGQIYTAQATQVSVTSLQPVVEALHSNLISLNALSAVTLKVPAASVTGLEFWIQFTDAQNKLVWGKNHTMLAPSIAVINNIVQQEGGVYIIVTPISNLTNWRVNYSIYGAKSLTLVDAYTFDLVFDVSGAPVSTSQVKQLKASNIQYQSQAKGTFHQLPGIVPINQATLLQFTA